MEHEKFSAAVERYGGMVTRLLLLRCRNPQDAEDCFQDVFYKLLLCETAFESEEHLKAWLIRVTLRQAADCNRQFWRRNVTLLGDAPPPEQIVTMDEGARETLAELRRLPPHQRDAIYLHCCEGYSVAEVADILKTTPGTVKSRLSRGRKALRERLKEEAI